MKTIFQFFQWLWDGAVATFRWLTSLPSILLSSFTGIVVTLHTFLGSMVGQSDTIFTRALAEVSASSGSFFSPLQNAPDIVKAGLYALSLDVLFNYVMAAFTLFVGATALFIEFWLVSFFAFTITFYGIKLFAWFMSAFVPKLALPGLAGIANADLPNLDDNAPIDV